MINISDSFYSLVPTTLDAKLCNFYYSGLNLIIETIPQYLLRLSQNSRIPGVIITVLLPKQGYSLLASYPVATLNAALVNFDIKFYTFSGGLADINFIEYMFTTYDSIEFDPITGTIITYREGLVYETLNLVPETGYSLISNTELTLLRNLINNSVSITLPDSFSVAGRCAAAIEGTDYPTG